MLLVWWAAFLAFTLSVTAGASPSDPFSLRMLRSIITRQQGIISSGASTSTLESGVLALALHNAISQYHDQSPLLTPYLNEVLTTIVPDLTNATADAKLPLDRFSIANALLTKSQTSALTPNEASALTALTDSSALQTRNPAGGLWYYVYPQWSYLDGIFSVLPFMASQPSPNYTDIALQINLLRDHCVDESGLLVHGYDYSKTAVWADPVTGGSPYVWGRSLGWFMGGLVEGWEILCSSSATDHQVGKGTSRKRKAPGIDESDEGKEGVCGLLQDTFTSLVPPLLSFADSDTGAWYQLTTLPSREGNFLESSSTVLFIWTLLKATRLGLLSPRTHWNGHHSPSSHPWPSPPPPSPQPTRHSPHTSLSSTAVKAALKAYHYATSSFIIYPPSAPSSTFNETIGFTSTVAVNSLNSTANYTYYTTRPILQNSLLGESAFVLASLEVEMMEEPAALGRYE